MIRTAAQTRSRWSCVAGLTFALVTSCSDPSSSVVEGLVTRVDGDLVAVAAFTVHAVGGEEMRFEPDPFGDFAFPLPHLSAHMLSFDPVRVIYRESDDGTLIAVGVDDA